MAKKKETESKKLHVEIMSGNWERIQKYIEEYNNSEERITPKIKIAHVVNTALDAYLNYLNTKKKL